MSKKFQRSSKTSLKKWTPVDVVQNSNYKDKKEFYNYKNKSNTFKNDKGTYNPIKENQSTYSSFSDLEIESWDNSSASSLSWFEEYDKTVCDKITKELEIIDAVLYDELPSTVLKKSLREEVEEWKQAFPHLRVRGKKLLSENSYREPLEIQATQIIPLEHFPYKSTQTRAENSASLTQFFGAQKLNQIDDVRKQSLINQPFLHQLENNVQTINYEPNNFQPFSSSDKVYSNLSIYNKNKFDRYQEMNIQTIDNNRPNYDQVSRKSSNYSLNSEKNHYQKSSAAASVTSNDLSVRYENGGGFNNNNNYYELSKYVWQEKIEPKNNCFEPAANFHLDQKSFNFDNKLNIFNPKFTNHSTPTFYDNRCSVSNNMPAKLAELDLKFDCKKPFFENKFDDRCLVSNNLSSSSRQHLNNNKIADDRLLSFSNNLEKPSENFKFVNSLNNNRPLCDVYEPRFFNVATQQQHNSLPYIGGGQNSFSTNNKFRQNSGIQLSNNCNSSYASTNQNNEIRFRNFSDNSDFRNKLNFLPPIEQLTIEGMNVERFKKF